MINQGLKHYTKQITSSIGRINYYVNPNPSSSNLIFDIPIILKQSNNMPFSLLFNYQKINELSKYGSGIKSNYDISIEEITIDRTVCHLTSYDGTIYAFNVDEVKNDYIVYVNHEVNYKIKKITRSLGNDEYRYQLIDKNYTSYFYDDNYVLKKIIFSNLDCIQKNINSEVNEILTYKNFKIEMEASNTKITRIINIYNDVIMDDVRLSYYGNRLNKIKYYYNNNIIEEYEIVYSTNYIEIIDVINCNSLRFYITNNYIIKIDKNYYINTSEGLSLNDTRVIYQIEYNNNYSKITDIYGDIRTLNYNSLDICQYEYDDKKNIIITNYGEYNRLLYQSEAFKLNDKEIIDIFRPKSTLNVTLSRQSTATSGASSLGFKVKREAVNNSSFIGNIIYEAAYEGKEKEEIMLVTYINSYDVTINTTLYYQASLYNDDILVDNVRFDINSNYEQMVSLELYGYTSFNKIIISINILSAGLIFSEFHILNKNKGIYYNYDDNGNITTIRNKNKITNYDYEEYQLVSIRNENKDIILKYNEYGQPQKVYDSYNNLITYTYDKHKVAKKEIKSQNGIYKIEYTHDSNDLLIKVVDNDNEINYGYNDYQMIKTVSYNGKSLEYSYDDYKRIKKIINLADSKYIEYEYYGSTSKIRTIRALNNSIYTYYYDSYNRIHSVYVNDIKIVQYTYDDYDRVTKELIGNSNYDVYEYQEKFLTAIKHLNSNRFTLTYDNNKLIGVNNHLLNSNISYEYDEENRINKVIDDDTIKTYIYHYDDNDITMIRNVKDFEIIESFNTNIGRTISANDRLNGLFYQNNKYVGTFFTNDGCLKGSYNGETYKYEIETINNISVIDNILCYKVNQNNDKYIVIDYDAVSSGGIGFWLKANFGSISYHVGRCPIFSINMGSESLGIAYGHNDKIKLFYSRATNTTYLRDINVDVTKEWHFIHLSWEINELETSILHYELRLDDEIYSGNVQFEDELYIDGHYYVWCDDFNLDELYLYITGIIMSISGYLSTEEVFKYYSLSKQYLFDNENYLDHDYLVSTEYIKKDGYNIYPLNGSYSSLNKDEPSFVDVKYPIYDKNLSFNFNNSCKRYVLDAAGSKLKYEFGNTNKFTIAMRVYPYNISCKQYLFYGNDEDNNGISLFIDSTDKISILYNNEILTTVLTLNKKSWNEVILSYDLSERKNSNFLLKVNNELHIGVYEPISSTLKSTYIGSDNNYENSFLGQMEMLITKNDYTVQNELDTVTELNIINDVTSIDSLKRVTSNCIYRNNVNFLKNDYIYNDNDYNNQLSNRIIREKISKLTSTLTERYYSYGSDVNKNNIIGITDSIFGNKTYEYNYRGFLTNDNGTSITYDNNGNILTYGTKSFTYDSTIKDRLISYNNQAISYSSSNPLLPLSYGNKTFSYEGNRLVSITESIDSYTTIYHNYYYNHEGLRIKKVLYYAYTDDRDEETITTYYYYNGDRLITEYRSDNDRIDFLYDNNGLLYGFINNKTERYYYVRDILQNILGIVDSNGNLIVKYGCNAYGELISITGNTQLALRNPFRYKGYYYDSETNMYYCKSRYYNPEWCRWLTPDDVEYLDPSNINGLNLYTYCQNNPIEIAYSVSNGRTMPSSINSNSWIGGTNTSKNNLNNSGLNLGWLANGLDTGSTIHSLYTSISGLINHTAYFAKNLIPFADDMTMLGTSMKDGVLAFNQFSWGLGKSDVFGIALGFGLDIYDSVQRGVSPGGVVLGATLTAAKGVGLIYLKKGILYGATALGSAIPLGVGTVVGFFVGGVVCVFVDIFGNNWLDDLIDKIAK